MNTIKKTGLSFDRGVKLTANDLSIMNNTINALVDAVNSLIMARFDVNQETKDYNRKYTLSAAVEAISGTRRQLGMIIRFLSTSGCYVEYSYVGKSLNDSEFKDTNNWITGVEVVDGGEF